MPILAYGEQDFLQIRENDNFYVDKTGYLENLLDPKGSKYYFFSRPRRFGKTLTLSTLKYIFLGERELFKGLAIEHCHFLDWESYPIIHLDINLLANETREEIFDQSIIDQILNSIKSLDEYNAIDFAHQGTAKDFLIKTVETLYALTKKGVVILIDEYDALLTENLNNPEQFEKNRKWLEKLYGVLKSLQPKIRFLFITGISRFGKTGLFSTLNNLVDLTWDENANSLCGFTQEELIQYFDAELKQIRDEKYKETPFEDFTQFLKEWYNGFSWNGKETVYSPASVLLFCKNKVFRNFWSETGRTKTVSQLAYSRRFDSLLLTGKQFTTENLETYDIANINIDGLLWQMGYLTVTEMTNSPEEGVKFRLDFPNREVRNSFNSEFLTALSNNSESISWCEKLKKGFTEHDVRLIQQALQGIYASLPYDDFIRERNDNEGFYRSILYVALQVFGSSSIRTEVHNRAGRIDLLLIIKSTTAWVLEVKYDRNTNASTLAQTALTQINENSYHHALDSNYSKIHLLGIGVSKAVQPLVVKIEYQEV